MLPGLVAPEWVLPLALSRVSHCASGWSVCLPASGSLLSTNSCQLAVLLWFVLM